MPRSPAPGRSPADEAALRLVRTAQTHVGRGLFARRRLAAGTVVGEIRGTVCDAHPPDPTYCMELPSGRLLEPAAPFRFLNHCCDPNCELFYWCEEDGRASEEDRLWVQTIRDVAPGEELLIDYAWPADAAIPCRCGAANCRGWIVDPDEWHLLPTMTPAPSAPAPDGDAPRSPPS
ncbi:MAG: SET domain-containing protein-lysine N-methyltransferase [Planctomycetes bacterium]|nr:SET domain-containing protein-lysine N-methyltransferase [Planctomycetota bacterium]